MNRPSKVRGAALLSACVYLGAAACALPEDASPTEIPKEALPAPLLATTTVAPAPAGNLVVYLVRTTGTAETLVPAAVSLSTDSAVTKAGDQAARLVEKLVLSPPTSSDANAVSAIPAGSPAPKMTTVGDILVVDFPTLATIEGARQRLAAAQIVFTATSAPGVAGVKFTADGEDVSVSVDDKAADPGAILSRSDFPSLLARQPGS
jgi:spore germination protein GerM